MTATTCIDQQRRQHRAGDKGQYQTAAGQDQFQMAFMQAVRQRGDIASHVGRIIAHGQKTGGVHSTGNGRQRAAQTPVDAGVTLRPLVNKHLCLLS